MSIKNRLDKVDDIYNAWVNIPLAMESQDDLNALDEQSESWWKELGAEITRLRIEVKELRETILSEL
jgi:hypothetical protein